jgi:hypothetical protein
MMNSNVRMAPISTTNITGFRHWMSGRSITIDCFSADHVVWRVNNGICRWRRGGFRPGGKTLVPPGVEDS